MAEEKKGKAETEKPKAKTPPATELSDVPSGESRMKKGNGQDGPAATISGAVVPETRKVIGCLLPPAALQLAVNVLKIQPWEDVADFMPALIQAKPIFEDELHEYQRKLAESESE